MYAVWYADHAKREPSREPTIALEVNSIYSSTNAPKSWNHDPVGHFGGHSVTAKSYESYEVVG